MGAPAKLLLLCVSSECFDKLGATSFALSNLCTAQTGNYFACSVHMEGTPAAVLVFSLLGRIWPCKD